MAETRKLVEQAVSGDQVALERLLLDHYDRLMFHLTPKIPARYRGLIAAEDILQDTYAGVFGSIRSFEPKTERSFFNWLAAIAENRLRDAIKAQTAKKRGGEFQRVTRTSEGDTGSLVELIETLSWPGKTPSQSVARREAEQVVHVAMAGLFEEHREIIRLRFFEGKEFGQIAELLGKTPEAVRALCHRAKQKLRNAMERSSLYLSKK